jgi:hypothetical protein
MLPVSVICSHKTLTIFQPDVINASWLDLMHSYKIAICHQHPPV